MALPVAWLVDVDGTLALHPHRDPYDWHQADGDLPNWPVVMVVQALAGHAGIDAILAITGRHERARQVTVRWFEAHKVPVSRLFMRSDGDYRADQVVKEELFRNQVEPKYDVIGVIDDRDKVVTMWRRLGLVCFQVAQGDF